MEDGCLLGRCALTMKAVISSETSVNFFQTTRRNIPEDSLHHARCRENLKSHQRTVLISKEFDS
jgi:hypothetical protein